MAKFQAYIDDSASDVGIKRLYLAGYISTSDEWSKFSKTWEAELRAAPKIGYLKMSEAKALRGEFYGWRRQDRDLKIRSLGDIIRRLNPVSIHCSVSRNEVENIIKPVAPYGFANPYFYCFQGLMVPIATRQAREGSGAPIDFIFDDQEGLGHETRFLYKLIREQQPKPVQNMLSAEPIFRDDKLSLPLQAADMLAWHVRRQAESDDKKEWFTPSFMTTERAHHISIDIPLEYIQRVAEGLKEIPGASELRKKSKWKETMQEMQQLSARGFVFPFGSRWKNALYQTRKRIAHYMRLE